VNVGRGDDSYDPRQFIRANLWTYAKSVPEHPHEYLPAQRATDPDEFRRFCQWVNRAGEPGTFTFAGRTHTYRYSQVDERLYWVSRSPWGSSLLVNRRLASPPPDPQLRFDLS
jgi:hypothetical protein